MRVWWSQNVCDVMNHTVHHTCVVVSVWLFSVVQHTLRVACIRSPSCTNNLDTPEKAYTQFMSRFRNNNERNTVEKETRKNKSHPMD